MPEHLIQIFGSVIAVSLVAFAGLFVLGRRKIIHEKFLLYLVSLSAGTFIGDVFLHLLPEATEGVGFTTDISFAALAGIISFFFIEKIIKWHHHHAFGQKEVHSFAYVSLMGDALHNFIDGFAIAASYLIDVSTGIATTFAVIMHEIPQEIGDYGILLHAGFSRGKAILMNFLTALTAIIGALVAVMLLSGNMGSLRILLGFVAGAFTYIATADLMPELHKKYQLREGMIHLAVIVIGIFIMYGLTLME